VSFTYRACGWRPASPNELRPSTSLHPAGIYGTYLSKLEKGASYPGLEIIAKLVTVPEVALAGRC